MNFVPGRHHRLLLAAERRPPKQRLLWPASTTGREEATEDPDMSFRDTRYTGTRVSMLYDVCYYTPT